MADEKRQPWMKWYPRDWRGDGALRMCSFAARGLWADLLSLIHDHGAPYGHLTINGAAPTTAQLARMLGGSPREIDSLTAELEQAGVFNRSAVGAIVCRRMVRDKAKADRDRENGKGGGNPNVKGKDNAPDNAGVNPQDKGKDKAHIPYATSQTISDPSDRAAPSISDPPFALTPEEAPKPQTPDEPSPTDVKAQFWRTAKAYLAKNGVKNPGTLVGKWCREYGDGAVMNALHLAAQKAPADPVSFIERVLRGSDGKRADKPNGYAAVRAAFAETVAGRPDGGGQPESLDPWAPVRGAAAGSEGSGGPLLDLAATDVGSVDQRATDGAGARVLGGPGQDRVGG